MDGSVFLDVDEGFFEGVVGLGKCAVFEALVFGIAVDGLLETHFGVQGGAVEGGGFVCDAGVGEGVVEEVDDSGADGFAVGSCCGDVDLAEVGGAVLLVSGYVGLVGGELDVSVLLGVEVECVGDGGNPSHVHEGGAQSDVAE